MTHNEFIARWKVRRDDFQRLGALVNGATLCDEILEDLESLMKVDENALLTLKEAAQYSGYSQDHLGRLVREGKIPNNGRPGAPLLQRGDVPRKPNRALAASSGTAYDPLADARKLGSRLKGGSNGLS